MIAAAVNANGWILPNGLGRFSINLHVRLVATAANISSAKITFIIKTICKFDSKYPPAFEPTQLLIIMPPVSTKSSTQSGMIFIATLEMACCAFCAISAGSLALALEKIITSKNKNPTKMIAQIR